MRHYDDGETPLTRAVDDGESGLVKRLLQTRGIMVGWQARSPAWGMARLAVVHVASAIDRCALMGECRWTRSMTSFGAPWPLRAMRWVASLPLSAFSTSAGWSGWLQHSVPTRAPIQHRISYHPWPAYLLAPSMAQEDMEMVELLLDHGAEPCRRPCSPEHCLLARAAAHGKCGIIRAMFDSVRRKSVTATPRPRVAEAYRQKRRLPHPGTHSPYLTV